MGLLYETGALAELEQAVPEERVAIEAERLTMNCADKVAAVSVVMGVTAIGVDVLCHAIVKDG